MLHRRHLRSIARLAHSLVLIATVASCSTGEGTAPGAAWSIDFSSSTLSFTAMNAAQSVTATVRDNKGTSLPDAPVSWSSENPSVAEVSGGGRTVQIVAKSPGATNIRVTSGSAQNTLIVTVNGVRAMQVDPANVSLTIGAAQPMTAHVQADPGVSNAVTWSTGNTAIATVNAQGVLTAVAAGATTVRATSVADPRYFATAQVAVAPPRGIVVAPTTASLAIGQSQAFSATVSLPAGQSTAIVWRTSSAAVATVNAQGLVTAVGIGNAVITAESVADPTLSVTAQVSVVPTVYSVSVSPSTAQVYLGDSQTLVATVTADPGVAKSVTWRSSNTAIANVSVTGIVTAVSVGSAVITAVSTVDTLRQATATIAVASRPVNVVIAQRNVTVAPGASAQLTATVTGDPGTSSAVTWSSSAPTVATISSSGLVSGIATGTTVITATSQADATKRDTVTVSVSSRMVSAWSATRLNGELYEDVTSLYAPASNDVFAVNLVGDVFRFDGTTWTRVLAGAANGTVFKAVHGTGATNVFAVGANGKVFRWQGSTWTSMATGTSATLNSVFAISPTFVMAVGANGTALQFNGTSWSPSSTGSSAELLGVWGFGATAFAVGTNGETLRYAGAAWSRLDAPTVERLNAVGGLSSTNVYAAGDFGTLLHFNGGQWTNVSTYVTADLKAVATSVNDARVVVTGGYGTILQVTGDVATTTPAPYTTRFNTAMIDANGTLWTAGQRGVVNRQVAQVWSTLNLAPDLLDVWSTSANDAWAVGEFGFIYRFDGASWTRQVAPTRERLNTVWAASATDAFAGGDAGVMLRWNGMSWSTMSFPSSEDVLAIWGTGSNNVYATTFGGEVLRFNGTSWGIVQAQANALYGVFGSSASDVYAIGERGTVLRYDGNSWTSRNVASAPLLVGLWSAGPTNVMTVGLSAADPSRGAAYSYNGTTWVASALPSAPPELTSVWGPNAFDMYATGGAGTILRYTGTQWQPMTTGTSDYLWSVNGVAAGNGGAFAVGYNTTVVTGAGASGALAASLRARATRGGSFDPSPLAPIAASSKVPDGSARSSRQAMHTRARARTRVAK